MFSQFFSEMVPILLSNICNHLIQQLLRDRFTLFVLHWLRFNLSLLWRKRKFDQCQPHEQGRLGTWVHVVIWVTTVAIMLKIGQFWKLVLILKICPILKLGSFLFQKIGLSQNGAERKIPSMSWASFGNARYAVGKKYDLWLIRWLLTAVKYKHNITKNQHLSRGYLVPGNARYAVGKKYDVWLIGWLLNTMKYKHNIMENQHLSRGYLVWMPGTFYQCLVLASLNVLNETLVKVGVGAKGLPMVCTQMWVIHRWAGVLSPAPWPVQVVVLLVE